MTLLSQAGYLGIAIGVLIGLLVLAFALFLLLRKGPKVERKKCAGCVDALCPIAASLKNKEDEE